MLVVPPESNNQQPESVGLTEVHYAQLLESATQLRAQHKGLKGKTLSIRYNNLCDFVTELLAFDGWCAELYLLPDGDSPALPEDCVDRPDMDGGSELKSTDPVEPVQTRWYLATSGTTDRPKWIGHSLVGLTHSIKYSERLSCLIWGLVYQPFRFAGLQVVLQALLTGAKLVDASSGDIAVRLQRLKQGEVTAISATPTLWRQFLMSGQLHSMQLSQLTLGGEVADQGILDALATVFSKASIRHIYASTEAGVGFAVSDRRAGFPRIWLEQGYDNIRFKVDEHQHLWIKPATLAQEGIVGRVDKQGYLDTEDLVELKGDRALFLGRASGAINVGGNKVHPQQVEQVLLDLPEVMQARVYGHTSSVMGQLVAAQIVATQRVDVIVLKKQILKHCMSKLLRHQVPLLLEFVEQIDSNAAGKIGRGNVNE
ncbi:AMP-binding protein [Bowmanella dokdonensis]|uniref:AMP-binding protein n=1 Tax=Bowmanella dokdonensis TaxID=751969 RepID=A0A939DQ69_9ALTE|nr:AMP-binding protein [Bowmanella dokdonensis]MBN7826347.1 AMP-binding protein [Bowmanella dokdonensis]